MKISKKQTDKIIEIISMNMLRFRVDQNVDVNEYAKETVAEIVKCLTTKNKKTKYLQDTTEFKNAVSVINKEFNER